MTYTVEKSLLEFDFWGGAKERADKLTDEELQRLDEYLSDDVCGDWTETDINDYFWHEEESYLEILGISQDEWDDR